MTRLAIDGGRPVTRDILGAARFASRKDLERKYLLEAYETGVWDDWPGVTTSLASRFADAWAAFNGARFCALVTNGTQALQLALETVDIGVGDEVIVPGLTWQATASAVCDVNAMPILVDVEPDTMCIDPKLVEAAITPRTRAIIAVHLYHRMADMTRLRGLARRHKLYLIEDTAHAHGSQWDGRNAGTMGDFGAFSFQRSKLITGGEGGAVLTRREEFYWRLVSQRSCGREYRPGIRVHSGNHRMTSFQAAVLLGQLAAFKRHAPLMDRNGLALDAAVAAAPGCRPLRRSRHLTRMCGYAFAFLYDPEAFDGLDAATFRRALSAELGFAFGAPYTPLSHSTLYRPHSKKRHQLSRAYLKAITPSRWSLPVADELYQNRAVLAAWDFLACPPRRARLLTDAIAKLHDHREALRRLAAK